jgi:threonylcarbamoyladenosine tRNA methylthiotransferase MtaB
VVEVVTDKRQLPELLARFGLAHAPSGIRSFPWRHRAWVKVQDGCTAECSYCIIPKVRPVLSSRPAQEVLEEIQNLCHAGYREIVLTGIHLGYYGADQTSRLDGGVVPLAPGATEWSAGDELGVREVGDRNAHSAALTLGPPASRERGGQRVELADLVEQILRLEGDFRIRLSSIEAAEVTPRLIALMAEHPQRICPHLHLPLQSGSDQILNQMRRRYDSGQFRETCRAVARRIPGLAVTTDVIVGFPGESEFDFQATCRVVEEVRLARIHVFRYSPREGTIAAGLSEQVPEPVKQRRAADLTRIGRRLHSQHLNRLAGQRLHVLVESPLPGQSGLLLGTSGNYAPVELPGSGADEGRLLWGIAGEVVGERIRVHTVREPEHEPAA